MKAKDLNEAYTISCHIAYTKIVLTMGHSGETRYVRLKPHVM